MSNMIPALKSYDLIGDSKISLLDVTTVSGENCYKELYREYISSKIKVNTREFKSISFIVDSKLSKEAYKINISEHVIEVVFSDYNGVLYALQTLRVLAEVDVEGSKCELKCGCIVDQPKHSWRAIMLDVARSFHGMDTVKRLLDMMVLHKMNVFHMHLTDDSGWRIEIKKYPLLTEKGSYRPRTQINGWGSLDVDETPHSGFYTQEDIKEIVAYAAARGIVVVPEIDMPGHFTAAFAGYPELACREIPCEPIWFYGGKFAKKMGIENSFRSACLGKPFTFEFIYNVLTEVFELFTSPYFHVGGDEAEKKEWSKCPHCAKYMEENGIANTYELQCYFINEISKFCKSHGKTLIGWNEVLEGGKLDNSTLVQYWTLQKDRGVVEHLNKGGKIILSKHKPMYMDMSYAQYNLKNMYNFNEHMEGIKTRHDSQIIGVEAPVWTEFISSREKLDMQLFPRMEALAEVCWGTPRNSFKEFSARLENFKRILDVYDIWYAEPNIASCKNPIKRLRTRAIWYTSNTELEFKENKLLRAARQKNQK